MENEEMRIRSLKRDQNDDRKIFHGRNKHVGMCVQTEFYQQIPFFFNREGMNLSLIGMYRGASCFMICGGPSLKKLDKTKFKIPGILTMTINNAISVVRSNMWCSVDEPSHFIASCWLDPTIMKFVPTGHFEKPMWDTRDGVYKPLCVDGNQVVVGDCPNVIGYRRNEKFNAGRYLWEDTMNWGDCEKFGGCRSVMLAAIKILFLLGIRRLYLCGVDFNMSEIQKYAFNEERSKSSIDNNNQTYAQLIERFKYLKTVFDDVGFNVMNCNPESGLKVFPFISFEDAINKESEHIGNPDKENTVGMYQTTYQEKQLELLQRTGAITAQAALNLQKEAGKDANVEKSEGAG